MFALLSKVVYWFDLKILCWRLKKDAVIIQIKTRKKKDIKSKQDSSIITLFFMREKRDKKKPKSYIYTYYSKSKPYRSAKKNLSNKSKKMRLSEAACVAVEPKKQNAYQGVTEVYLLLLFCWMNLTVLSKCDRKVRFFFKSNFDIIYLHKYYSTLLNTLF